ncbi:hypothetical protein [Marinisporobacter balticus]|uniref:Uncharacterized protein n=1 Tax=Marinisporobacter balticus TaxID=2018667 RepID=A0A4R2LIB1_9FIRM|nr:hypothetical protein [Marinisporobacter balticus]TCO79055.1 hypothetical protein EV214_103106 [Marinisporobacter balticus]
MSIKENTNIHLCTLDKILHFFSESHDGISYFSDTKNEKIKLCNGNILEFDVAIDTNGNIGVVILDSDGDFFYNYYDGQTWTTHLLYEIDLDFEEFKYINIKFSLHSPYILFCWHNLDAPNLWSIVAYYKEERCWKKQVLTKLYLKENIKPYILISNEHHELYFIYLNNNNIIYDLMIRNLSIPSYTWSTPILVSNCIFLKSFHLDAIVGLEDIIHICWIDKIKKNYCIKYISFDCKKHIPYTLSLILEINKPIIRHQLLYIKNSIICYTLTKENIFYSLKLGDHSTWNDPHKIDLLPTSIYLIKFVKSPNSSLLPYHANYILSENPSDIAPIFLHEIEYSFENEAIDFTPYTISKKNSLSSQKHSSTHQQDQSVNSFKKVNLELYNKNQELEMKNNLLKTLESNISFLKDEIKQLKKQNEQYLNMLHENSEKHKEYQKNMNIKEKHFQNILSNQKLSDQKNKELLNEVKTYKNQLEKMQSNIHNLHTKNILLEKQINKTKSIGLFRNFFH